MFKHFNFAFIVFMHLTVLTHHQGSVSREYIVSGDLLEVGQSAMAAPNYRLGRFIDQSYVI